MKLQANIRISVNVLQQQEQIYLFHIIILSAAADQLVTRRESSRLPTNSDSIAGSSNVSSLFMDPSHSELIQMHRQEQRGDTGKKFTGFHFFFGK